MTPTMLNSTSYSLWMTPPCWTPPFTAYVWSHYAEFHLLQPMDDSHYAELHRDRPRKPVGPHQQHLPWKDGEVGTPLPQKRKQSGISDLFTHISKAWGGYCVFLFCKKQKQCYIYGTASFLEILLTIFLSSHKLYVTWTVTHVWPWRQYCTPSDSYATRPPKESLVHHTALYCTVDKLLCRAFHAFLSKCLETHLESST